MMILDLSSINYFLITHIKLIKFSQNAPQQPTLPPRQPHRILRFHVPSHQRNNQQTKTDPTEENLLRIALQDFIYLRNEHFSFA